MKDEKDKVERLLQQNTDEQLADFDWDQLRAAISTRVDRAEKRKASRSKYPIVFNVAAGIAAAAAVVIVALTLQIEKPPVVRLHESGTARVELIARTGSASIEIKHATGESYATVAIGPGERKLAKCDIEVIDSNGSGEASDRRAAWIIISRPEPMYADNGWSRDMKDVICLF